MDAPRVGRIKHEGEMGIMTGPPPDLVSFDTADLHLRARFLLDIAAPSLSALLDEYEWAALLRGAEPLHAQQQQRRHQKSKKRRFRFRR